MKLFYDFFPIIIFFIIYKVWGIYPATFGAIIISIVQVGFFWWQHRRFDKMQLTTLFLVTIFGGATLVFHNPLFIKWKISVLNWLFALAFLGGQFIGKKNFLERMIGDKIVLSKIVWRNLNVMWVIYFAVLGFINWYVIYHFSTAAWVNFKLFGVLGLTIIFAVIQSLYLAKYVR